AAIRQTPWPGATLENQAFTPAALRETRRQGRYEIVHLATHARFLPGEAQSSCYPHWYGG
ncbi:MAG: CHAT domain-containing protein, partial [Cyanobacteria bacterium RI_101]|nr:CHAT domain-containing protein [Cyanobacteria bacterium RI_101]